MKKAIVTGATSGIGRAIAIQLAEDGYQVGITGRRTHLLERLQAERPQSFLMKTVDVTDVPGTTAQLEQLVNELGGLDLLVLSSGTGDLNEALDFAVEQHTIDTNVTGFTNVATWVFNYFAKQGSGHLAAITSVGGLRGSRQAPAYNATKAFQVNYLEGLRQKATRLKKPVYITEIRPGLVDTAMAKGEGLFWVMPLEVAVPQMMRAIRARKKVAYVTKRWGLLAQILKRIPRWLYDKM